MICSGDANLEERLKDEGMFVFMTDQHFPYVDERMERITKHYVYNNSDIITHIVFGGDGVDNPAMSRFIQRPSDKTLLQEEIDMFVSHMADYHKLAPQASILVLMGNHDVGRFNNTKAINRSMASLRVLDFSRLLKESIANQEYNFSIKLTDNLRLRENYFTHGDPKIDPYLKGGATGARRTAEMHPEQGNIIHGHTHRSVIFPRTNGKHSVYTVGMMADKDKIAEQYKSFHGYQNGFLVGTYDRGGVQIDNLEVKKGLPLWVDGEVYD